MRLSTSQLDYFSKLLSDNPAQALAELRTNEATYADDPTYALYYGAFLIDGGVVLGQANTVERGVQMLRAKVTGAPDAALPTLLYNIANGLTGLYELARQQPGFRFDPDDQTLVEAKGLYRQALSRPERIEPSLRSMMRVNYGNCLAHLGRSVEAIDAYDLALQDVPTHAMALGNLAIELERYASVVRDPSLLVNARDLLHDALAGSTLEETGLATARPAFARALARLDNHVVAVGDIQPHRHHQGSDSIGSERDAAYLHAYLAFCRQHHLFLNLCLRNRPCTSPERDTISLSMTTAVDDDTTFYRLARIINEIKERYAVSRSLLFEACDPPVVTEAIDGLTQYVDNLDYAVYGIRVGKLKLAFESTYNVLDKIAYFVNDYLALGMRERDVSFSSIWRERKANTIRPALRDLDNWYIFGLYDVARDLGAGNYLSYLSDLRNFSTHRYLVTHVEVLAWRTEADGGQYHVGYRELLEKTLTLMHLVRSAITYLIAFIDAEERKKRQGRYLPSAPIFMPLAKPHSLGPQDTSV